MEQLLVGHATSPDSNDGLLGSSFGLLIEASFWCRFVLVTTGAIVTDLLLIETSRM